MFPVFSAVWFNTGYMLRQFTEASMPVMLSIMSAMDQEDSIGDIAPRAVFLSFLVSRPHARNLGRYGPDGQLCGEILVPMAQTA